MAGHALDERPPSGGGREIQTTVQSIGPKDISVRFVKKRRRIRSAVAVDTVSNALDGISEGRD